jgi:hypothetical protein
MDKLIAFFIIILACAFAAPKAQALANPEEDKELCEAFTDYEKELSKRLPLPADSITEVVSMQINCATKRQTWTKRLVVTENEFATGWRERKQQQHMQLHCNGDGLASTYGWTVIDKIFDKNYKLLIEIVTTPNDCSVR